MPESVSNRRSADWFGRDDRLGYSGRAWFRGQGMTDEAFRKPVIGIANSWSELTPCNGHLRELAEFVRRGVLEAGGTPLEFPVMSLGESVMRPSTMLYRNLAAMETEELLRANPLDGVVLLAGCDKTTPSMLMGAASADLPTLVVTGGPMLNGRWRGADLGAGTGLYRMDADLRAGRITTEEFRASEAGMIRSPGFCQVMGSASSMAILTEAMGLQLSGTAAIPAVDARRKSTATEAGRRIVGMVDEGVRLSSILDRRAFENAICTWAAIGGSTNTPLHLLAIARRLRVPLTIHDFDALSRDVPLILDLMPSGRFQMEEFFDAGGVPALLRTIGEFLHLDAPTVSGRTLGEEVADAEVFNAEVIRPLSNAVHVGGSTAVVRGSLAPGGALIKQSASVRPELLHHKGRAVVFDDMTDYLQRIDSPDLEVDAESVLVLRSVGPVGYPGMPEVGNLSIPSRLLAQGVTDMVRISDGRMSGTGYGTVVVHVTPESAVGGPLALVRTGDLIELNVTERRLDLLVAPEELDRRRRAWSPPEVPDRGYEQLHHTHVLQADNGADFDFLDGGARAASVKQAF